MRESLRIDYSLSDWPVLGYLLVTLLSILCVLSLPLQALHTFLLSALLLLLFCRQLRRLLCDAVDVVRYDGERWFISCGDDELLLSSVSYTMAAGCIVLQGQLPQGQRRVWFFMWDNCAEQQRRQLSRVLLHQVST